jgi:hypothetical protein
MIKPNIYVLGLILLLIIVAVYLYRKWNEFEREGFDDDEEGFGEDGFEDDDEEGFDEEGFDEEDGVMIEGFKKKKKRWRRLKKWGKRLNKVRKFAKYLIPGAAVGILAAKLAKKAAKRALRSKYGQRLKRKLSEKAKEKAKEKIMAYLEEKAKTHPKIKPVIDMLRNNEWVPVVAAKLRENPQLITVFSVLSAKYQAGLEMTPQLSDEIERQLGSSPQIKQALITLQSDPDLRDKVKLLLRYPVVKQVTDELASDNGIVRKTKNVIRIIKSWLRTLRKPGEGILPEDDISMNDLPADIKPEDNEYIESVAGVKQELPPVEYDDFEGYIDYDNEWASQFKSINSKKPWDINTQINMSMH